MDIYGDRGEKYVQGCGPICVLDIIVRNILKIYAQFCFEFLLILAHHLLKGHSKSLCSYFLLYIISYLKLFAGVRHFAFPCAWKPLTYSFQCLFKPRFKDPLFIFMFCDLHFILMCYVVKFFLFSLQKFLQTSYRM